MARTLHCQKKEPFIFKLLLSPGISATERNSRAIFDFLNFLSNFINLGQLRLKAAKTHNCCKKMLPLFTHYLWVKKLFNKLLTKQTSRSGFIGKFNVLSIFSSISWKHELKMKTIWHCNNKDTALYNTLCFSYSKKLFDEFLSGNN